MAEFDVPHGNSKNKNVYIRSTEAVKQTINEKINQGKSTAKIYAEMVMDSKGETARNSKQIQNAKFKAPHTPAKHNLENEIIETFNLLQSSKFVQAFFQFKQSFPNVILYSEEQIKLMQSCIEDEVVLCIDKTYNLSRWYATIISFKNIKNIRIHSGDNPIMIGPIMLHYRSDCRTFSAFFNHLRSEISVSDTQPIFGCDQEKALVTALKDTFREATILHCERHVKENTRDYLKKNESLNSEGIKQISDMIFLNDGLLSAKSGQEYYEKVDLFNKKIMDMAPKFFQHFNKKLKDVLFENCLKPTFNGKISVGWTNNNAESANHVIKSYQAWKVAPLPTLIQNFHELVETQMSDVRRSLVGEGNFETSTSFEKFNVSRNTWLVLTEEEKSTILKGFLQASSQKSKLQLPEPRISARKPHQRRRSKAEKTCKKRTQ